MRSRWPLRLSGVAVGAALALAPASLALGAPTQHNFASTTRAQAVTKRLPAHDVPADGFNAVLAADDHNIPASNDNNCAGITTKNLIAAGKDVWLFTAPTGTGLEALQLIFLNPGDGLEVDVTIPSGEYGTYVGTGDDKQHAAIAVPTGWQLVDGDAKLTGTDEAASETPRFAVEATCVGSAQPPATPTPGTSASAGGAGGGDLPITGTAIGAIVLIGFGLLASGVALMAVRRRREIDLTEQF